MSHVWNEIHREAGFVVGVQASEFEHYHSYIKVADDDWSMVVSLWPDMETGRVTPGFSGKNAGYDRLANYTHELRHECLPHDLVISDDGLLSVEASPHWMRPDPFNFRTGFTVQLPPAAVAAVRFAIIEAFKRAGVAEGVTGAPAPHVEGATT